MKRKHHANPSTHVGPARVTHAQEASARSLGPEAKRKRTRDRKGAEKKGTERKGKGNGKKGNGNGNDEPGQPFHAR